MGSAEKNSKSKGPFSSKRPIQFAVCVRNDDYPASLERRKIYEMLPDPAAERMKQVRVRDESGEDYLYPAEYFRPIKLPVSIKKAVEQAQ
jgi:hypothetical protein